MNYMTTMQAVFCALCMFAFSDNQNRQAPGLPEDDRIRIAEAYRMADSVQDAIWPHWSSAPFGIMLVTNDYEYLVGHPHATNNFDTLGYDNYVHRLVLDRKRLFPTNLLATFPAINDVPTIVVGQTANTNVTSSTAWVVTVLHEHFHQYQQSQPDYFSDATALGLSKGDNTGMWMLNYPFPYDSTEIDLAYATAAAALMRSIKSPKGEEATRLHQFLDALHHFRALLTADDYKYFAFQCWQEGVARYTELRVAQHAAQHFTPDADFRALKDYKPFAEVADSIDARVMKDLGSPSLSGSRRAAFYAFGAGEALLLDKVTPGWKSEYFRRKFDLEPYFPR